MTKNEYLNSLDIILELNCENEPDGVGYCVWSVVECFRDRCGKVKTFSDVLIHSAFDEDMFYSNSDIACAAYGNVCLSHKEAVRNLSMSYAESGDCFHYSRDFERKLITFDLI